MEKSSSILKIFNSLYFTQFHQLGKLWYHDDYQDEKYSNFLITFLNWESLGLETYILMSNIFRKNFARSRWLSPNSGCYKFTNPHNQKKIISLQFFIFQSTECVHYLSVPPWHKCHSWIVRCMSLWKAYAQDRLFQKIHKDRCILFKSSIKYKNILENNMNFLQNK